MISDREADRLILESIFSQISEALLERINQQLRTNSLLARDLRRLKIYLQAREAKPLSSPDLEAIFNSFDLNLQSFLDQLDRAWKIEKNPRSIIFYRPGQGEAGEASRLFTRCLTDYQRLVEEVSQIYPDILSSRRPY